MVRNYYQYHSKMTNSWIPPLVNSKDGADFAMLFTLETTRKAGGLQIQSLSAYGGLLRVRISLRSSSYAPTG